MRRRWIFEHRVAAVSAVRSISSSWGEGNDGHEWKARELNERRQMAIDMLYNVSRRKLLCDAARDRCKRNLSRLSTRETNGELDNSLFGAQEPVVEKLSDDALVRELDDLLSDEGSLDTLEHIPLTELKFLREELYAAALPKDDDVLKKWMKLRRNTENSFSSLPEEERNLWSAWYLRDVASRQDGN